MDAAPRASQIRDRIKELRRVRASELRPDVRNPRRHPDYQRAALRAMLAEVGFADALLARETPEGLVLIDGHLRAETAPDQEVPVLVLDVTEEEAGKVLATLDPLAGLAEVDPEAQKALLEALRFASPEAAGFARDLYDRAAADAAEAAKRLAATAPAEFPAVGDDLATEHRCPRCGYEWSGQPRPGADG